MQRQALLGGGPRIAANRPVVVGIDGSPSSYSAVEAAARLVAEVGAELIIVEAYEPASEREVARYSRDLGDLAYQVAGSCPAEADAREALMYAQRAGATARYEVRRGQPAAVLRDVAREAKAALIVVGEPGHEHSLGKLFDHGTVAKLRDRAPCQIHVVPCKGQRPEPLFPAYWAEDSEVEDSSN